MRKRDSSDSGHFVREWRIFRQLSQEQLAELVDKTHGAISLLERGKSDYTQSMLESLADALGCEPFDLLLRNPLTGEDRFPKESLDVTPVRRRERRRFYFREWRSYRGLTQEQLAEKVEMSTSSISQLESGKQGFTDSTLVAIADALQCEPGDLLRINPLADGQVVDLHTLLSGAPQEVRQQACAVVTTLLQTSAAMKKR